MILGVPILKHFRVSLEFTSAFVLENAKMLDFFVTVTVCGDKVVCTAS